MAAAERDIVIEQGATFTETRVMKTADPLFPDDRTKDVLMNLTGYSGRSQARGTDSITGLEVVITFTVTVDPGTSQVVRSLSAAATSAIPTTLKKIVHDLELYTAADANVIRVEKGNVTLSAEVTKPVI